MLGKLIKYDLKANVKMFAILLGIVAAMTAIGKAGVTALLNVEEGSVVLALAGFSSVMGYMLMLIAAGVVTCVMLVRRFYSNLFGGEGYLTFTLPVKASQILNAKIISAVIWTVALYVVYCLSLLCMAAGIDEIGEVGKAFYEILLETELTDTIYIIAAVLTTVFDIFVMILGIYLAICLGQLFTKNRILFAVLMYFAIIIGLSIIRNIFQIYGTVNMTDNWVTVNQYIQLAISVIFTVVSYFSCRFIVTKKINLE